MRRKICIISCVGKVSVVFVIVSNASSDTSIVSNASIVDDNISIARSVSIVCNSKKRKHNLLPKQ